MPGAATGADGTPARDVRVQTEGCIANLRAALAARGLGLEGLVDVTVFLVSMDDYEGLVETWNRFLDASGPTRTTLAVRALPDPQLAVEMKAIASFAAPED